jgi:hypothetical protein
MMVYLHSDFNNRDDSVAQLVEHYTFNVGVLGSNPSGITEMKRPLLEWPFSFAYTRYFKIQILRQQ